MVTEVTRERTDEAVPEGGVWPILVYETRPSTLPKAIVMMLGDGENARMISVMLRGGLLILDEHPIEE